MINMYLCLKDKVSYSAHSHFHKVTLLKHYILLDFKGIHIIQYSISVYATIMITYIERKIVQQNFITSTVKMLPPFSLLICKASIIFKLIHIHAKGYEYELHLYFHRCIATTITNIIHHPSFYLKQYF